MRDRSAEHRLGALQTRWKLAEAVLGAPVYGEDCPGLDLLSFWTADCPNRSARREKRFISRNLSVQPQMDTVCCIDSDKGKLANHWEI